MARDVFGFHVPRVCRVRGEGAGADGLIPLAAEAFRTDHGELVTEAGDLCEGALALPSVVSAAGAMVVLGEPGAGKTSVLRDLTADLPRVEDAWVREGDPVTVHPFIEAEKTAGHNVKRACELLKVSRAAHYARRTVTPGPRAVRDAELTEQITAVHEQSRGTYGAPRVHAVLRREGDPCGRRRMARLMRLAGLAGRHRRRRHRTTIPDPQAATRPDLVGRDFRPDPAALDTRWCGDITYIATDEGRLYLATVIDIASRRVVGWATADHLRTELVADALRAACPTRRPAGPVIFHSDRGSQYTSRELACLATEFGIRLSVGRTGQCWDNALAESFFSTLKNELGDNRPWPSRASAHTALFEWIESWYNLQRLHSSLDYRSPADYETAPAA